ncbi:MAG: BLUF domain-containing protein [Desulfobacterales bacterium]|nr:BLUF domain-containing protein [Desulfobacterales bacterium]
MEEDKVKEKLVHCIYSSTAVEEFSESEIVDLLAKARQTNSELGVTGMLLYDKGSFFQVIEGEPEVITSLLASIEKDKRHDRFVKIIYEEIDERDFSEWTMGYSGVTRKELNNIEGLNDFFRSNRHFTDLDEGRAKVLLKAFKDGKWRASIS